MANVELVIKLPEEKYNMIKNGTYCGIYDAEVYKAIADGTLLQKGHGGMIDVDAVKCSNCDPYGCENADLCGLCSVKILIEADKGAV